MLGVCAFCGKSFSILSLRVVNNNEGNLVFICLNCIREKEEFYRAVFSHLNNLLNHREKEIPLERQDN